MLHRIPLRELALAAAVFCMAAGNVLAHGYEAGDLRIGHPWTRATPEGAKVAGGYLSIINNGAEPDRLIGGSFAHAPRVEIHEMAVTDGVATMRPLREGLDIAPGATVKLAPGGYHLMLMDLQQALQEGEKVKGTLEFERAGTVEVEFAVESMGARGSGKDHGNGHSGSHGHAH